MDKHTITYKFYNMMQQH